LDLAPEVASVHLRRVEELEDGASVGLMAADACGVVVPEIESHGPLRMGELLRLAALAFSALELGSEPLRLHAGLPEFELEATEEHSRFTVRGLGLAGPAPRLTLGEVVMLALALMLPFAMWALGDKGPPISWAPLLLLFVMIARPREALATLREHRDVALTIRPAE